MNLINTIKDNLTSKDDPKDYDLLEYTINIIIIFLKINKLRKWMGGSGEYKLQSEVINVQAEDKVTDPITEK